MSGWLPRYVVSRGIQMPIRFYTYNSDGTVQVVQRNQLLLISLQPVTLMGFDLYLLVSHHCKIEMLSPFLALDDLLLSLGIDTVFQDYLRNSEKFHYCCDYQFCLLVPKQQTHKWYKAQLKTQRQVLTFSALPDVSKGFLDLPILDLPAPLPHRGVFVSEYVFFNAVCTSYGIVTPSENFYNLLVY